MTRMLKTIFHLSMATILGGAALSREVNCLSTDGRRWCHPPKPGSVARLRR